MLGFDGPERTAQDANEVQGQCFRCRFDLGTRGVDLLMSQPGTVVAAGDLGQDKVADLLGRQIGLLMLAGARSLQCPVSEAQVANFSDQTQIASKRGLATVDNDGNLNWEADNGWRVNVYGMVFKLEFVP